MAASTMRPENQHTPPSTESVPVTPGASGSRLLRSAGLAVAAGFRLVPEARRFDAAIAVARWLEPLIARTRGFQERARHRTDDLRETSLELLLMMLTRHGTTFQLMLRMEGAEHLPGAPNGGTLVVGSHMMLNNLFTRYLEDAGQQAFVISPDQHCIAGTRTPARVLSPSAGLLFRVRRHLADGHTVVALIDRGAPERRNRAVQTASGTMLVSDALLQLAIRQNARVVFLAAKMDDSSRVVIRLSAPSSRTDLNQILRDFADFIDEAQRIGALRRSLALPGSAGELPSDGSRGSIV
jgi:hypothetical protein